MTSDEDLENSIYILLGTEVFWAGSVIIFYFSSQSVSRQRRGGGCIIPNWPGNINIVFPSILNRIILMLAILE